MHCFGGGKKIREAQEAVGTCGVSELPCPMAFFSSDSGFSSLSLECPWSFPIGRKAMHGCSFYLDVMGIRIEI